MKNFLEKIAVVVKKVLSVMDPVGERIGFAMRGISSKLDSKFGGAVTKVESMVWALVAALMMAGIKYRLSGDLSLAWTMFLGVVIPLWGIVLFRRHAGRGQSKVVRKPETGLYNTSWPARIRAIWETVVQVLVVGLFAAVIHSPYWWLMAMCVGAINIVFDFVIGDQYKTYEEFSYAKIVTYLAGCIAVAALLAVIFYRGMLLKNVSYQNIYLATAGAFGGVVHFNAVVATALLRKDRLPLIHSSVMGKSWWAVAVAAAVIAIGIIFVAGVIPCAISQGSTKILNNAVLWLEAALLLIVGMPWYRRRFYN